MSQHGEFRHSQGTPGKVVINRGNMNLLAVVLSKPLSHWHPRATTGFRRKKNPNLFICNVKSPGLCVHACQCAHLLSHMVNNTEPTDASPAGSTWRIICSLVMMKNVCLTIVIPSSWIQRVGMVNQTVMLNCVPFDLNRPDTLFMNTSFKVSHSLPLLCSFTFCFSCLQSSYHAHVTLWNPTHTCTHRILTHTHKLTHLCLA